MSANKYLPYVCIIPEDDANRQLALGFRLHDTVDDRQFEIRAPAGGWQKVYAVFEEEYLKILRQSSCAHVVLLVDFDNDANRTEWFASRIPDDVKERVFIIGALKEPETLKREWDGKGLEQIGTALADECQRGNLAQWRQPQLAHNESELQRLVDIVKPILFC